MSIKLQNTVGGLVELVADPSVTTDEMVVVSKSDLDAIKGIDPRQLCTAWINFNGVDGTIRDSYNVSNLTKVSSGTYEITFENAMDNDFYTLSGSCGYDTGEVQTNVRAIYISELKKDKAKFCTTYAVDMGIGIGNYANVTVQIFGGKN